MQPVKPGPCYSGRAQYYRRFGSAADGVLAENAPVLERVVIRDTFGESGKPQELLDKYISVNSIKEAVRKAVGRKK